MTKVTVKEVIKGIEKKQKKVVSIFYVGCGASHADLYPAVYFLRDNARKLRVEHFTANEFNYATPVSVDETAIVITASLGGTTPETVEATAKAKELGAHVIALTNSAESPIAKAAEYVFVHGFAENYGAKQEKMGLALMHAVEILNTYEKYEHYDAMQDAYGKIFTLINESTEMILPRAQQFGADYKDVDILYVMGSGATRDVSYSTSICLWLEMQWLNSSSFHTGEFFHGPFEIVEKDVPFLLLMNDGKTREMDARALTFLQRFDAKTSVIDAKDFGLATITSKDVIDYFNPLLITGIIRVYAEELARERKHPLTTRRYMWKLEY